MKEEVPHQPCPYVECGSSDAFAFNTSGFGRCHSCERSWPPKKGQEVFDWAIEKYPYKVYAKGSGFGEDKSDSSDSFTDSNPTEGEYVPTRGIKESTMKLYDVRLFKGQKWAIKEGNEWVEGYSDEYQFPYPSGGRKLRRIDLDKSHKAHFGVKKNGEHRVDELFGMQLFPKGCSKIGVTVVEGEWDALSAYQMLYDARYVNPVVSVPSATPSKKMWEKVKPWLDSFEKIILSVDNDEAGRQLAKRMHRMFPNKVYVMDHGKYKDASDFLQDGAGEVYRKAWWNAQKYTPENVRHSTQDLMKLYEDSPNHQYVPTGIPAFDDKALGLMVGHFTVFKAPTGIGKTELMRFLENALLNAGVPFASWHLEETALRSLLGLVSYRVDDNVTRKDLIEEKDLDEEVRYAIKDIGDSDCFYQFSLEPHEGADELCEQIRYFAEVCGCKFIFFEPIQDVISGGSEDKEAKLADLSVRLSKLAADLNVGIVSIGHTNENGDFKYCKMIGQRASVIVDLKRDKESQDHRERNTLHLFIEKNRPTSEEGPAGDMFFQIDTFKLENSEF